MSIYSVFSKRASQTYINCCFTFRRTLSGGRGLSRFLRYAPSRVSRLTLILPESTPTLQATEWIINNVTIPRTGQKVVCELLLSVPAHAFPRAWLEPPRSQRARHCGVSRLTLILRESAPALQATECIKYKVSVQQ